MKKISFRVRNFDNEQFLTFNIDNNAELDDDVLDFLEDEEPEGIVPVIFEEGEEFDTFSYEVTGKIQLRQLSEQEINAEMVLKVLRGLVISMMNMSEYRIPLSYLVLNRQYIYIDSDYKVEFVCIPLEDMNDETDLSYFLRTFIASLRFDSSENGDYVAKILTYVNDEEMFNLHNLLDLIEEWMDRFGIEIPEGESNEIYGECMEIEEEPEEDSVAAFFDNQDEDADKIIDEDTDEDRDAEADVEAGEAKEPQAGEDDSDDAEVAEEATEEAKPEEENEEQPEVAKEEKEEPESEAEKEATVEESEEPEKVEEADDGVDDEANTETESDDEKDTDKEDAEKDDKSEDADKEDDKTAAEDVKDEKAETAEDKNEPEESNESDDVKDAEEDNADEDTEADEVRDSDSEEDDNSSDDKKKKRKKAKTDNKEAENTEEKKEKKPYFRTKEVDYSGVVIEDELDAFLAEQEEPSRRNFKIGKRVKINRASILQNTKEELEIAEAEEKAYIAKVRQEEEEAFLAKEEARNAEAEAKKAEAEAKKTDKKGENEKESDKKETKSEPSLREQIKRIGGLFSLGKDDSSKNAQPDANNKSDDNSKEEKEDKKDKKEESQDSASKDKSEDKKAEAEEASADPLINANPYLIRVNTEEKIMINKQTFKIGKSVVGADYTISGNGAISRIHAIITGKDGEYFIKDNKSTNHTFVNGESVEDGESVQLTDDSKIVLGDEEFIFKLQ